MQWFNKNKTDPAGRMEISKLYGPVCLLDHTTNRTSHAPFSQPVGLKNHLNWAVPTDSPIPPFIFEKQFTIQIPLLTHALRLSPSPHAFVTSFTWNRQYKSILKVSSECGTRDENFKLRTF